MNAEKLEFGTKGATFFRLKDAAKIPRWRGTLLLLAAVAAVAALIVVVVFIVPARYTFGISVVTLPKSYRIVSRSEDCLKAIKGDTVLTLITKPAEELLSEEEKARPHGNITLTNVEKNIPPTGAAEILSKESVAIEGGAALCVRYEDADGIVHTGWWWIWDNEMYHLDKVGDDTQILKYIPRIRPTPRVERLRGF